MGGIGGGIGLHCERKHKLPEIVPSERSAWWSPIVNTFGSLLLHAIVFLAYMWQRIAPSLQRATQTQKPKAAPEHSGPSVAFSGCAFWWPYHAGVCQYLFEEFDLSDVRVHSTSASTFPVVCTVVGVNPLLWCDEDYPKCLEHWWSRPFSCFVDSTDFLRGLWHSFLPKDAYKRVEGHLVVSVTNVEFNSAGLPFLTNEQASSFQSNDDLVDALMATINVPGVFFRGFPKWRGRLCVDGYFSEQSHIAGGKTVVINLAPGASSDIRPSRRLPWSWLFFPQPMQQTKQMMNWGYEDARTNRAVFESKGWRPKTAGPADAVRRKN